MKVLFIGPKLGNSYLQYLTLKKIYKKVDLIDANKVFFFVIYNSSNILLHLSTVIKILCKSLHIV